MTELNQYPLFWYAQSSNVFYSAKKIENISTKESSIADENEEFKSDEYLTTKKLNQQGIYRYGITNDLFSKQHFLDFYFQDNIEDFHYKTLTSEYIYGISITFKANNVKKTFNHFSKYLTITKASQKTSDVKFTDIFVYKFGHADVSFGESQSFTHDGYSVGFKASLKIDEEKTAEICIRGNIAFNDPKPTFHVIITPSFDCTCEVKLWCDDQEYLNKNFTTSIDKNNSKMICIERKNEKSDINTEEIKKDYKEIARFIDWEDVPKHLRIDWNNDDIETIGVKFLKWESHIKYKPPVLCRTKYFDLYERGLITYHNKDYYDYLSIILIIHNEFDTRYELTGNGKYTITKNSITFVGDIENLSYIVEVVGYKDKLPTITLSITTHDKTSFSFYIASPLPFKFKENKVKIFTLDNETLTVTTTD